MARKGNLFIALVLEVFGIWIAVKSYKLGLQTFHNPGAGLFPFLLGLLLCGLTFPLCSGSIKEFIESKRTKSEGRGRGPRTGFKSLGAAVVCLIGYLLLLGKLGFLITTFLFLFGLLWIGYPRRWLFITLFSAAMVFLSFLLFDIFLKVSFPPGFWG